MSNSPPLDRYVRWSVFLASLRKRVDEICAEADAGTRALIAQDPTNVAALKTAQHALNERVDGICGKIEATWHAQDLQRQETQARDGSRARAPESAYQEWHATERYLVETWTACKVRGLAALLRAAWPFVDAALKKPIPCSRCGAALSPKTRLTSESVTCPHCQSVNQCVPDPLIYTWSADAPHNLGLEQVLTQRFQVLRAGEDVKHWIDAEYRRTGERPKEGAESKQRRAAMAHAYYIVWAAARASILPVSAAEQAADVERSMVGFRRSLED